MENSRRYILKYLAKSMLAIGALPLLNLSFFKGPRSRVYRNRNVQTRTSLEHDFYWEVRPFGNPHPKLCQKCEGFISESVSFSSDRLTKTVETVWISREAFMAALPPEHFEQPHFNRWHSERGMTFSYKEDWIFS